jgi:hypothetical protein
MKCTVFRQLFCVISVDWERITDSAPTSVLHILRLSATKEARSFDLCWVILVRDILTLVMQDRYSVCFITAGCEEEPAGVACTDL